MGRTRCPQEQGEDLHALCPEQLTRGCDDFYLFTAQMAIFARVGVNAQNSYQRFLMPKNASARGLRSAQS